MINPASPSSREIRSANFTPAADALREPTSATMGRASAALSAAHRQEGRRIVDHAQARWVVELAQRDPFDPERYGRGEFALGLCRRADACRPGRPAAAGQFGQRREGRPCSAIVVDQGAEGAGTDVLAADEAKPVDPLLIGQPHARRGFPVRILGHAPPAPQHGCASTGWQPCRASPKSKLLTMRPLRSRGDSGRAPECFRNLSVRGSASAWPFGARCSRSCFAFTRSPKSFSPASMPNRDGSSAARPPPP